MDDSVPGDQVQSDGTRTVNQTEWQQTLDDCYGARQGVAGHKTPTNIELIFPGRNRTTLDSY